MFNRTRVFDASSSSPGTVQPTHTRTTTPHLRLTRRCRLFQTHQPDHISPQGHVVKVWDFVEEPYEARGSLPEGKLLLVAKHSSPDVVRRRVDHYLTGLRIVHAPSWGYRGM